MIQTVLKSTEGGTHGRNSVDCSVSNVNSILCASHITDINVCNHSKGCAADRISSHSAKSNTDLVEIIRSFTYMKCNLLCCAGGSIEQELAVEVSAIADSVDLSLQLLDLLLHLTAIQSRVGSVGRLCSQLNHTV